MNTEQTTAIADASEQLAYASLSGDPAAIEAARNSLRDAQAMQGDAADRATMDELVRVDPVSAAALGWLSSPELEAIVLARPSEFLYPEEVAAVVASPGSLRLVVLARREGRAFADIEAEFKIRDQSNYALAARGNVQNAIAYVKQFEQQDTRRNANLNNARRPRI
ncbi:hypothetical protein [Arthrobacter glacialis]|uniref:Uncharacterized protein n=1 Tax=Arthrobacter glacialis TaxID=1664 RepID=A0A2S4A1V0_ARTGL|nr:hypothetical protein [Arthrobacter glacialis]POH75364.1 hypothetical protein CVS27_01825 [Arthrobacter glacialis]